MTEYKVTEFNKRRLSRGEKYCFRADIFEDDIKTGWCWLSINDITEIIDDKDCDISGHELFNEQIFKNQVWDKLWK